MKVVVADGQFDFEVLANTAYDRSESTLHLPVQTVIKHIQKDNCLVSHENVLMPEELYEYLLDQLQRWFVVTDLSNKKVPLELLNELDLLNLLTTSKGFYKLLILFGAEGQALNFVKDELQPRCKTPHALNLGNI